MGHIVLAFLAGIEGVLFVGRAQEKALVWRTQRRYNQAGEPYERFRLTSNYRTENRG